VIESPFLKELEEQGIQKGVQQGIQRGIHYSIVMFLRGRFGSVRADLESAITAMEERSRLEDLLVWASQCPDLEAFRAWVESA
jgi:hypothetical protein